MRIVAYDIEATGLEADWGRVLCASFLEIKDEGQELPVKTIVYPVRPKDPLDDKRLVREITDHLRKYHVVVGWNSKLYDAPYLNARLLKHGLPDWNPQMHLDLMWYASGNSARLASRKLDNVAKFFKTKHQKHEVSNENWQKARYGDKDALAEVVKHCEEDVRILSDVYWHLIPRVRNLHR